MNKKTPVFLKKITNHIFCVPDHPSSLKANNLELHAEKPLLPYENAALKQDLAMSKTVAAQFSV